MSVLGTVTWNPSLLVFHGLQGLAEEPIQAPILGFDPVLSITLLPGPIPIRCEEYHTQPTPKR